METFRYLFLTVCSVPTQAAIQTDAVEQTAVAGKLWNPPVLYCLKCASRARRRWVWNRFLFHETEL